MLRFIPLLCLLLIFDCQGNDKETEISKHFDAVSGTLQLFLYRRDAAGLYVQFELKEQPVGQVPVSLTRSEFLEIQDKKIAFHLPFNPNLINEQHPYRLEVVVAEDAKATNIITTASFAVLTLGKPAKLNLVISQPPIPIE